MERRAPLDEARAFHIATLLADGRVLVTGGVNGSGAVAAAEIYDPAGNTWTPAGTMDVPRVLHSATRMANGQVLVVAGRNEGGLLASAEIYDPVANQWRAAASIGGERNAVGAALLPSGKVLVLGTSSRCYDPGDRHLGVFDTSIGLPGRAARSQRHHCYRSGRRTCAGGGYVFPPQPR